MGDALTTEERACVEALHNKRPATMDSIVLLVADRLVAELKKLRASERNAALEEAAKVCDGKALVMQQNFSASGNGEWLDFKGVYETLANDFRSLKTKEQADG